MTELQNLRSQRVVQIVRSLKKDFYNQSTQPNENHGTDTATEIFFDYVNGVLLYQELVAQALVTRSEEVVEMLVDSVFSVAASEIEDKEMLSLDELKEMAA